MSCQACKVCRDHVTQYPGPLEKHSDMPEEMKSEAKDTVANAFEKHPDNYELAAKFVKEQMDKKFGSPWHVVMGEAFGYDISYESKHLMFMFMRGYTAVVIFKAL